MKKLDWLKIYDILEYTDRGYTLKQYCDKNNLVYNTTIKYLNRKGINIIKGIKK